MRMRDHQSTVRSGYFYRMADHHPRVCDKDIFSFLRIFLKIPANVYFFISNTSLPQVGGHNWCDTGCQVSGSEVGVTPNTGCDLGSHDHRIRCDRFGGHNWCDTGCQVSGSEVGVTPNTGCDLAECV